MKSETEKFTITFEKDDLLADVANKWVVWSDNLVIEVFDSEKEAILFVESRNSN